MNDLNFKNNLSNRDNVPSLYQPEFMDYMKVFHMRAKKYKANGWLDDDGHGTSHKEMHASMFRHLAKSSAGQIEDDESDLDHLLHVAGRALMLYTRRKRGIVHPDDAVWVWGIPKNYIPPNKTENTCLTPTGSYYDMSDEEREVQDEQWRVF